MKAFAALADPTRLEIIDALRREEKTVNEIVDMFELSQPAISRHLRVLRDAELVSVRVDAQRRVYSLNARPLRELDQWLGPYRAFWTTKLDALDRHLDTKTKKGARR